MPFAHLDAVLADVAALAERFDAGGQALYLVGGIVRDQWLDHEHGSSADIDLTTDARPARIKELVGDIADALWTQGERFGTIGVSVGGRLIEITTHRSESYDDDSRKPEVVFGDDIGVDLSRRDFTVNAMALTATGGELVDPYGGADDLAAGVLRTPLDPSISFGDDPLRMLRAARFAAKYSLVPDPDLVAAATEMRERLRIVAIERIGAELERLFGLAAPRIGIDLLVDTGLAEVLLTWADAPALTKTEADRLGPASAAAASVDASWRTRLAIWLLSALDAPERVAQVVATLRLSRDDERHVIALCRAAKELASDSRTERSRLRRWLVETAEPEQSLLVAGAYAPSPEFEAVVDALVALRAEENVDDLVPIDGQRIMTVLGVGPGPAVGQAISVLRQALYDQGPLPAAAQEGIISSWWSDRTPST